MEDDFVYGFDFMFRIKYLGKPDFRQVQEEMENINVLFSLKEELFRSKKSTFFYFYQALMQKYTCTYNLV